MTRQKVTTHLVENNHIQLCAYTLGQPDKPPVVLVHGYPDNHSVWLPTAQLLANDYYVITYDVRGTGASRKPTCAAEYKMQLLASDLNAVVDHLIPDRSFHLAGHDWGSIQSWESVTTGPLKSRILSFTSISGPCLDHVGYWMRNHLSGSMQKKRQAISQLFSSWYIMMFQLPLLPPFLWRNGLDRLWPTYLEKREKVVDPDFNPTQREDGIYGINMYRANFIEKMLHPEERYVACPVQLVVPLQDNYVGAQLFDELHYWAGEVYRKDIDAGHWVLLSDPQLIADSISNFIDAVDSGTQDKHFHRQRVHQVTMDL